MTHGGIHMFNSERPKNTRAIHFRYNKNGWNNRLRFWFEGIGFNVEMSTSNSTTCCLVVGVLSIVICCELGVNFDKVSSWSGSYLVSGVNWCWDYLISKRSRLTVDRYVLFRVMQWYIIQNILLIKNYQLSSSRNFRIRSLRNIRLNL